MNWRVIFSVHDIATAAPTPELPPLAYQHACVVWAESTDAAPNTNPETLFAYDPQRVERAGAFRINKSTPPDRYTIGDVVVTDNVPNSMRFKVYAVTLASDSLFADWMDRFELDFDSTAALMNDVLDLFEA